jgi:hypothetical protein
MAKQEIQSNASLLLRTIHHPCELFLSSKLSWSTDDSQESAQQALELHGKELAPGQIMNVFVSDPNRKKERTDADAASKEVYVAGLSKFTTEADLEKVFKTVREVCLPCFRLRLTC